MRLAGCYFCNTLTKLPDYGSAAVDPDGVHDSALVEWIERHKHGVPVEETPGPKHGGAILMPFEEKDITIADGKVVGGRHLTQHAGESVDVANEIETVRMGLEKATHSAWSFRDEFKEEAGKCFLKHHSPSWPDKKCSDYRDDSKLLGRKNMPKEHRIHLCSFCPYEETVRIEKRWRAGQYRR
jgi:hypothetical protein